MLSNRSIPDAVVIPVLAYADVGEAVTWLGKAFGFVERLRIGDHRAQMYVGEHAAMVVSQLPAGVDVSANATHAVMVRVDDAHAHFARSQLHGARVINPPTDYSYGERQYTVLDPGGHSWTFSESIADVAPESWGGVLRDNV